MYEIIIEDKYVMETDSLDEVLILFKGLVKNFKKIIRKGGRMKDFKIYNVTVTLEAAVMAENEEVAKEKFAELIKKYDVASLAKVKEKEKK